MTFWKRNCHGWLRYEMPVRPKPRTYPTQRCGMPEGVLQTFITDTSPSQPVPVIQVVVELKSQMLNTKSAICPLAAGMTGFRRLKFIGLFAVLFLSGCDLELIADSGKRVWTEDVRLDDGSVIQVRRTVKFTTSNSWSGDAYNSVERDATISFTGTLAQLPAWRAPRMALVLYQDKVNGQWVIVTTTGSCEVWAKAGKPKPSYWEYRLKGMNWQLVPLTPASLGRKTNLYTDYDRMHWRLIPKHITGADVQRIDSDPMRGRQYREVWGDPDMYVCGEGDLGKVR